MAREPKGRGFTGAPDAEGRVWLRDRVGGKRGWLVLDTETHVVTQAPGTTRYRARVRIDDAAALRREPTPPVQEDQ